MKGIILAAGRGKRMGDITFNYPKCLTTIGNRKLIEWQQKALKSVNINDIAIVTGYKSEMLEPYANKTFYNDIWHDSNMVTSLIKAHLWLSKDECIVSYSDIVYDKATIDPLVNSEKKGIIILSYKKWKSLWENRFEDPFSDAETFKINEKNELIEIGKKPTSYDEVQGQYMGLIKFSPEGWLNLKHHIDSTYSEEEIRKLDVTSLLSSYISVGGIIHVIETSSMWIEIDSKQDLEYYQKIDIVKSNL